MVGPFLEFIDSEREKVIKFRGKKHLFSITFQNLFALVRLQIVLLFFKKFLR